jgi:acyl-CoA reductase-like NAD-dependent aldehyde dehydrogenase
VQQFKMWIGGKWVDAESGKTFDTYNPATGEKYAQVPQGDKADVDKAVEAARKAFPIWSQTSINDRISYINKIVAALRKRFPEMVDLEVTDHGTPIKIARGLMGGAPGDWEFTVQSIRSIVGEVIPSAWPALFYTRREPRGVCALINPWNVPTAGAMIKLSACLSTGNTCVFKPSSISPLGILKVGEAIEEAGLPTGTVNIVTGPGGSVGESLVTHPDVRMVSFTGSSEVGRRLMSIAAASIKKLQMELGGKNPFIVLADANIDAAAKRGVSTSFFNTGMVCVSPGRYYIHESIYDEFVNKFVAGARNIVTGDPRNEKTDMGPLASAEQRNKVEEYIKIGINEGAKLVLGGKRLETAPFNHGYFILPTVFANVTHNMRIAREEIFGPVVSLIKFSSEEEVVSMANDSEYGLSASVWTRNVAKGINLANRIQSGQVWINDHQRGGIELPAGGYKQSGFSKEKGLMGMEEFTQVKVIGVDLTE